jgi:hypothetical protein
MLELIGSSLRDWSGPLLASLSPIDVLFVLLAVLTIGLSKHAGMWMYALVALPGTLAHELAHFIVALILGAHPSFPSLIPVRTQRGWRLGAVAFRVGRLRALPIALAPLALLPLALWWAHVFLHSGYWPLYCANVWIIAALLTASLPSKTDWKLAFPALGVVLVIAAMALLAWVFWWRSLHS